MAITDLTNTTWVVPAGWSATAGLVQANITGSVLCEYLAAGEIDLNTEIGNTYTFAIGYGGRGSTPTADKIYISTSGYGDPLTYSLPSSEEFTITITGGADATNPTLITWLETYSEKPVPTNAVTVEYNGSVIAAIEGGKAASISCKDKLMRTDIVVTVPELGGADVPEWDGSYTISGGTISFTVGDDTYQAEDGMTWAEWVASDYNTDGYYIQGSLVMYNGGYLSLVTANVAPTDTIVADAAYGKIASGGAD